MIDLSTRRQLFAEEIEAVANLTTAELVDALAAVPREAFLRAGPWLVVGEGNITGGPRLTPDRDPRHVYHNYSIAIDPQRQLFNGSPALLAGLIDALKLRRGDRVLHIGAGLGYYSAVIGNLVGASGRVVAVEVDAALAEEARANLSPMPWIEVRHGDGTEPLGDRFEAVLVNAGVTHPQDWWLDGVVDAGRIVLPLTVPMPAIGPTIGKGVTALLTKRPDGNFDARMLTYVAIYSAVNLRDEAIGQDLGQALVRTPFPRFTRLRRDAHDGNTSCWLHSTSFCLSTD